VPRRALVATLGCLFFAVALAGSATAQTPAPPPPGPSLQIASASLTQSGRALISRMRFSRDVPVAQFDASRSRFVCLVIGATVRTRRVCVSRRNGRLRATIAPTGPVLIGGVCQGGAIAHAVASKLIAKGRQIGPLVFIEYNRLVPYEGAINFIYTEDSYMNPAKREDPGLSVYDQAYGDRYTLKIIPGEHGNIFLDPSIHFLAASLKSVARSLSHGFIASE